MTGHFLVICQFWQDTVSQLFTQFDTPLVEGVDIQNNPLGEDFVFIQGNQRPKLNGVISRSKMELVGRLPSNFERRYVRDLFRVLPAAANSASTSSRDLPKANASVCAKKLDNSFAW